MIEIDDIKEFIETSASDFSDSLIQNCIDIAITRFNDINEQEAEDNNLLHKKALILLAISELATQINLYWKGQDKVNIIRTKDIISDIERLLKKSSTPPIGFINLEA